MFLSTLGLKESMVLNWVKGSVRGLPKNQSPKQRNINRNNTVSIPKSSLDTRLNYIKEWFKNLPKMPSHYCRKRSEKLYLEGPFNNSHEVFIAYKKKSISDSLLPLILIII